MPNENLLEVWDEAAHALEVDPMRHVRYGKCFRYLRGVGCHSKLLEVGCGEGTGLLIARHLGFKKLVGVEVSKERLKRAKDNLGNQASLILVSPDNRLPFSDGCFDIVVSAAVIEHTHDPDGFVREMARVVRPGGYVIISSDCYQWRILQLLGIYRSTQPVDKALFPTRLFRIFKDSSFQLVHYEGFPLPGQELRFLRMIVSSILRQSIIRQCGRLLQKLKAKTPQVEKSDRRLRATYLETLDRSINERWTLKRGLRAFLKLLFSDENVFSLVKE